MDTRGAPGGLWETRPRPRALPPPRPCPHALRPGPAGIRARRVDSPAPPRHTRRVTPRRRSLPAALLALPLAAACAAGPGDAESPGSAPATRRIGDVLWYDDYDAALAVARRRGVALWVHFGEDPG